MAIMDWKWGNSVRKWGKMQGPSKIAELWGTQHKFMKEQAIGRKNKMPNITPFSKNFKTNLVKSSPGDSTRFLRPSLNSSRREMQINAEAITTKCKETINQFKKHWILCSKEDPTSSPGLNVTSNSWACYNPVSSPMGPTGEIKNSKIRKEKWWKSRNPLSPRRTAPTNRTISWRRTTMQTWEPGSVTKTRKPQPITIFKICRWGLQG